MPGGCVHAQDPARPDRPVHRRRAFAVAPSAHAANDFFIRLDGVTGVRHTAAGGDEGIDETVTLSFGAVSETYTKQAPNGTPAGNVFSSWNTITNAASMISPDGNDYCANSQF